MKPPAFRWIHWNVDHIGAHGVEVQDAEYVVGHARSPYPHKTGDEKWLVWVRTESGEYLQVVFVPDDSTTAFVIHARPLSAGEKRQFTRQRK